jgi:hypothetical protein
LKLNIQLCILLACMSAGILACHASGIDVTIQNNSSTPLRNVELDYPSGAFGAGTIAAGGAYWYHIKPTEDGVVAISFDQQNGKTFRQKGPEVHAGQHGQLLIVLEQDTAGQWQVHAQQR